MNENNEIFFWKIFHNKVLRNNIIHQIEELNKSKVGCKRYKFKDINSLSWIIKKQQSSLLKCKLEANEEININKEVLSELFKQIIIGNIYYCNSHDHAIANNNVIIIKEEKQYLNPNEFNDHGDYEGEYFKDEGAYKKGEEYIEIDLDKEYENHIKERENQKEMLKNSYQIFLLLSKFKLNELMKFRIVDIILEKFQNHNEYDSNIYDNQLFNELLFNEPYCNLIIIDEQTIELAIKKSTSSLLNKLLSSLKNRNLYNQVITQTIKNNSISWINNRCKYRNEMYELILNDQSLYNIPPPPPQPLGHSPSCKRFKSSTPSPSPNYDNKVEKIDVFSLMDIKSSTIQNKLLDLNYFTITCEFGDSDDTEHILKLLDINNYSNDDNKEKFSINIGNNSISNTITTTNINNSNINYQRIKSILKLCSKNEDSSRYSIFSIYGYYLSRYDEPIDGVNDRTVWKYALLSKSVCCLNYLLSKYRDNLKQISEFGSIHDFNKKTGAISKQISNEFNKDYEFSNGIYEFIKLCTANYKYLPFEFDKEFLKFIFSIKSNQEYEIVSKSIIRTSKSKQLTDRIPLKWCEITNEVKEKLHSESGFLIQDTETIDFVFNGFNYITLYHKYLNGRSNLFFKFETYQLIEYAYLKYGLMFFCSYPKNQSSVGVSDTTIPPSYYIYPYAVAINNCDVKSLKYIDKLFGIKKNSNCKTNEGVKFNTFEYYHPICTTKYSKFVRLKINEVEEIKGYPERIKINFNHHNQIVTGTITNNSNTIIQVLEYFNSTGYKLFSNKLFMKFIKDLSKLDSSVIKVSDLKIDFQLFQKESFQLILESITNDISPNTIQIVLNNFNPFKIEMFETIQPLFDNWSRSILYAMDTSYYFYNYIANPPFQNNSIWCLYFISNFGENDIQGPFCSYSYESAIDIISSIEILLNHTLNYKSTSSLSVTAINIKICKIYEIIQSIINHLFKRLIKVNQVSIDQVNGIYQHIKSTWLSITGGTEFIFEHTQYHVFFYLGIRSIELMNYMMGLNYFMGPLENITEDTTEYYSNNTLVQNLFDPTFFSYNYIFNTPYVQLFEFLKYLCSNANQQQQQQLQ